MHAMRVVSSAVLAACFCVSNSTDVFAGGAETASGKSRRKAPRGLAPVSATAVPRTQVSPPVPSSNGPKLDTVTEYRNELGQTVYSVAASRFDISRPLREMAATGVSVQQNREEDAQPTEADDATTASELPGWRVIHSNVRDPVVQVAVQPGDTLASGSIPPAAPTVGFNFAGTDQVLVFADRSDSNGSVGNNQFVEVVNVQYQVWSLDRATKVATSVLGPSNVNTLWAGFGGACETFNDGDPIVLFDKTAKRCLISQPTFHAIGSVYYQCVAVSTSADATGSYARYAFAVPGGFVSDYAKFGAWRDAYYVSASWHAPQGGGVTSMSAAMDRTKMLAGNPTATWVVILGGGDLAGGC